MITIAPIKVDLNAGSKKAKNGIANMKIDIEEYGKFVYIFILYIRPNPKKD